MQINDIFKLYLKIGILIYRQIFSEILISCKYPMIDLNRRGWRASVDLTHFSCLCETTEYETQKIQIPKIEFHKKRIIPTSYAIYFFNSKSHIMFFINACYLCTYKTSVAGEITQNGMYLLYNLLQFIAYSTQISIKNNFQGLFKFKRCYTG